MDILRKYFFDAIPWVMVFWSGYLYKCWSSKGEKEKEYLRGFNEGFEVCRDYLRAYHEGELNQVNNLLAKASQRRRGQKDLDHDT